MYVRKKIINYVCNVFTKVCKHVIKTIPEPKNKEVEV